MVKEINIRIGDQLIGMGGTRALTLHDILDGARVCDVAALAEVPILGFSTKSYVKIYETITGLIEEFNVKEIYYKVRPVQIHPHDDGETFAVCKAYFIIDGEVAY